MTDKPMIESSDRGITLNKQFAWALGGINFNRRDEVTQSIGAAVARTQVLLERVIEDNEDAKVSRKEQYRKMDEMGANMTEMKYRLTSVESQLAVAAPTIAEFLVIKQRVIGAGALGRWLWLIGGVLLGTVSWIAGLDRVIVAWLTERMTK